jgi:hypothetical protein
MGGFHSLHQTLFVKNFEFKRPNRPGGEFACLFARPFGARGYPLIGGDDVVIIVALTTHCHIMKRAPYCKAGSTKWGSGEGRRLESTLELLRQQFGRYGCQTLER